MIKLLLITLLILFGCGQADHYSVDISNTTILWQNTIDQNGSMYSVFEETKTCMSTFGFARIGHPYVIITEDGFYCNGFYRNACIDFDANTIYLIDDFSCHSMLPACVSDLDKSSLRHEVVHWVSRIGDAAHKADYMQLCAPGSILY